jgi:LacI family transcriptional regulator, repressor for deo operon, udp, cdd, tsx, nupC, and nupG
MAAEDSKPATIRDVARRAGVSATTVSRALRGNVSVAPATRVRIESAAADMGYRVPRRSGTGQLVAVITRYPAQWFCAEAIDTVEQTLRGSGHDLVLFGVADDNGRANMVARIGKNADLAGMIIVATSFDDAHLKVIESLGIPAVVIGGWVPGLPRVGIDDEAAARMATRHILALGHRDVGLIEFQPDDGVGQDTTAARRRGFDAAMAEAGVEVQRRWVLARESTVRGGVRAAEDLLSLPKLPTALVAMSDEMALGVLWTLRRAGITVPQLLSVIGIDDHEMAAGSDLTTIAQPVADQARQATEYLLDLLAGRARAMLDIDLPARLVVRGSTGPRAEDPAHPG